jgi:hypothetical protein
VTRSAFADLAGWSLTETGRRRNEEQLREELDGAGGRADVIAVHERFLPWNARAARAFTAWQLDRAEEGGDRLGDVARALADIEEALTARLARFGGYHDRFAGALARAAHDRAWITGVEIDSAHRVWFELHEDLIATLGLRR